MKQIQYGTLVICPINTYKSKHQSKEKLEELKTLTALLKYYNELLESNINGPKEFSYYLRHEILKVQQEIMNL